MKRLETLAAVDFDALLLEAQKRHNEFKAEMNAHAHDKDPAERNRLRHEWHDWVEQNLTNLGIMMTVEAASGRPTSLFVVVAGNF